MAVVLVVDDEVGIRELLSEILADEGHTVRLAENARAAREWRARERPDLVLLDIWMPDTDGISLLKEWASGGQLTMPVVMMSGHASIDTAVEATRIGALDFLEKPIALQRLLSAVKRALSAPEPRTAAPLPVTAVGRSPALAELRRRLDQVAQAKHWVCLRGEQGMMPELYARALTLPGAPFANLTAALAEVNEEALRRLQGGVLFIDDLAALSKAQARGLGFVCARAERAGVRMVVFSSQDVAALAQPLGLDAATAGRLSEIIVPLPPLREHLEDVPDLAVAMLARLCESGAAPVRRLSTGALNVLRQFSYPRNLEQLEQVLRSAALAALTEDIGDRDVERIIAGLGALASALPFNLDQPLREARDAFERLYFEYWLERERGSIARVAEKSGMERTHLYRKLRQLGINPARRDEDELAGPA
jgi:two-component system, NtrC family, nitrogen regulation response regulator NtrX